jgi:hypothetical protein
MQKLAITLIEVVVLGFTAILTLANPVVYGVEYVTRKVRARNDRRH